MLTVTQDVLDEIYDRMSDEIMDDIKVRTDYSGRAMYGKECIGFVSSSSVMMLMALTSVLIDMTLEDRDVPDWRDLNVRQDSMGYDTIVYFPNWKVED